MRFAAVLSTLFFGQAALAEGMSITQAFDGEQARASDFALGLAYVAPGQFGLLAKGPIHKGAVDIVDDSALWHIGSITKSFTATLVMQQVDRGHLDLDAPISTYINADLHPDWQRLTLREILSHTAGLRRNPRMSHLLSVAEGTPSAQRRAVMASFWSDAPRKPPGVHVYSNLGYILAGVILEEVTGTAWETLIKQDIAVPLGLETLGFGAPSGPTTPWGHRDLIVLKRPVAPDSNRSDNPAWLGPAGTLHMSLKDLLAWGQAHLDACAGNKTDFLSAASCQAMQHPTAPDYGFGWVIDQNNGYVWHNGSNTMNYAQIMLHPESGAVVAVAQNTVRGGEMNRFATAILTALTAP